MKPRAITMLLVLLLAGCSASETASNPYAGDCLAAQDCSLPGVRALFAIDADGAGFFERPWPSDVRLTADGHLDLAGFPNPAGSSVLGDWIQIIQASTIGFGANAAVYFAFEQALDPTSLPQGAAASLEADASVFLVELPPGKTAGSRIPLAVRFLKTERQFTPAYTLVLRPVLGFPLRSATPYAAVVTRKVRSVSGKALGASAAFERTKYATPPTGSAARAWYDLLNPVYTQLETLGQAERAEIAALTVFTTQDIPGEMDRVRAFVQARPKPTITSWKRLADKMSLVRFEGWFTLPEYQQGTPPDFAGGGGAFVFDGSGAPVPQREVSIPFTLAVPKGVAPPTGFPIVMIHHGTGGTRSSFCDGVLDQCDLLATLGIASISIDQPLHGVRNTGGWDENSMTFNIGNIRAFRDNFRQGAADLFVLRRLLEDLAVPAALAPDDQAIWFDDDRVALLGHSQGSMSGSIFLGEGWRVQGAVLSAAGGNLSVAILERKNPVNIRAAVVTFLMIEDSELDLDHPALALFQTFAERADALNYARRFIAEPPADSGPRHLFLSEGLHDDMTMPVQEEILAAAAGCTLMNPIARPIEAMTLRGAAPLDPPIAGNASGPDGEPVTAVLVQYPDDGHFAIYDNPDAKRHYLGFLDTLLNQGAPSVGP